jgi:two-component system, LytTR family, response regulator
MTYPSLQNLLNITLPNSLKQVFRMKKRIILIDDEPNSIKLLQFLIAQNSPELEIIGAYTDAQEGLTAILNDQPDLVFLDIEMPHLNGFEILDRCPTPLPFHLIFTTAYNQYAVRAFRYSAMDYLLKPVSKTELINAIQKALQQQKPQQQQVEIFQQFSPERKNEPPKKLTVSTLEGLTFVDIKDIIHCDSEGAYTRIFVEGDAPMFVSKSIKEIEDMLEVPFIFRVHHSHLINLQHVKKYIRADGGEVLMSNGNLLAVSRTKKQEFLDAISRF